MDAGTARRRAHGSESERRIERGGDGEGEARDRSAVRRTAGAIALAACLSIGGPAFAKSVCADPNDAKCEPTIQDAIDVASSKDTVQIGSAFFNENVVIPAGKDGLTLRGSSKSILDADDPLSGTAITVMSANVTISGFTILNGQSNGIDVQAPKATIEKMTLIGLDADCIDVASTGTGTVVSNSELQGCGDNAIDSTADQLVIEKNTIRHCDSSCVEITGDEVVIENNTIEITEDSYLIDLTGDDAEIVKNTLFNSDSQQIYVVGDSALIEKNDTGNGGGGIYVSGANPRVMKNTVAGIVGDVGIDVDCTGPCNKARVEKNDLEGVADDSQGYRVSATAAGMKVEKNTGEQIEDVGMEIGGTAQISATRNDIRGVGGDRQEYCYQVNGTGAHVLAANRGEDCHGHVYDINGVGHLIANNGARDGIASGFSVDGAGVTLERNSVTNVAGFGYAVNLGATSTQVLDNSVSDARSAICDEGAGTTLSGNSVKNVALPDQLNTGNPCPID